MTIHTVSNGPVTTVIMERPDVRNAVDPATADALVAAFDAFNRDTQAKVAVFFGAHGTFCAGCDLEYGAALIGRSESGRLPLCLGQRPARRVRRYLGFSGDLP